MSWSSSCFSLDLAWFLLRWTAPPCGNERPLGTGSPTRETPAHGLSQQGVWVPFWTPKPLKRTPQDTQIFLCGISKNPNLKLIIEFFHLLIIPMTLFNDIMPYFDEFIHVYGWNMSILWSPLKIWTPKNFTTANFRHPVSKSWLRHCWPASLSSQTVRSKTQPCAECAVSMPVCSMCVCLV